MRHLWRKLAAFLFLGALFLFTVSGAALAAPPWSDAPNEFWKQTYGVTDAQLGIVAGGYADGTFRPYRPVTRAEFAKMAVSGLGIPTQNPATPTFIDVLPGSTFYPYVEGAYAAGLLEGMDTPGGKVFAPNSDISRQQTNSILGHYLSGRELEVTGVIAGWTGGELGGATYPSLEAWYLPQGFDLLTSFMDYQDVLPAHAPGTAYLVFHQRQNRFRLHSSQSVPQPRAAAYLLPTNGLSVLQTARGPSLAVHRLAAIRAEPVLRTKFFAA